MGRSYSPIIINTNMLRRRVRTDKSCSYCNRQRRGSENLYQYAIVNNNIAIWDIDYDNNDLLFCSKECRDSELAI